MKQENALLCLPLRTQLIVRLVLLQQLLQLLPHLLFDPLLPARLLLCLLPELLLLLPWRLQLLRLRDPQLRLRPLLPVRLLLRRFQLQNFWRRC